jgi:hypothetical protein
VVDFTGYLFWGGLVLALSGGMLLAVCRLTSKVQALHKSVHLWKNLSIGASLLAGVIILDAGLVAATAFRPYAPPPQRVSDRGQPDRASGAGTPPFGRWDEGSLSAQTWPQTPPKIGKLELKPEYWGYIEEAAQKYHISPFLIQAVCAIESRYDPQAKSGRCRGLMQLHEDTAKKYGVNPLNPRENILAGAAVLASLLQRYDGDLRRVLRTYNATSTLAYEREVIRAYKQAKQFEMVALPPQNSPN